MCMEEELLDSSSSHPTFSKGGARVNRPPSPTIMFTSRRTTVCIVYIAWFQDSIKKLVCKAETKLEEAMAELVHMSTSIREARDSKHESTRDMPLTKSIDMEW